MTEFFYRLKTIVHLANTKSFYKSHIKFTHR